MIGLNGGVFKIIVGCILFDVYSLDRTTTRLGSG